MTNLSIAGAENKRDAFAALALPYMKSIYNTALRLTRHPENASDLVQETYLRAYRTFANFTPGTNCKAWLFTIMYSIFVNKYRKEQREPVSISIDELEEKYQRALATWDPPHLEEVGTEVNQALDRIPESFRSAVLLVDVEELSYEEAAAILNCPLGTLRSRLFRARKLLFLELQPYARKKGYTHKSQA
jgi:RNA polymerase sigma-70 factor, ECF subfamily